MKYHWLNKKNNDELIVFFAGWSFDFKPFEFLECAESDVLFVYDYNEIEELNPELFNNYAKKTLITWSMGVFAANLLQKQFKDFDKKIAVNGTPLPVDDEFGIPQKPFILTLRHAKTGLEGKFYKNVFDSESKFEKYLTAPVERTIENRVDELNSLYNRIKTTAATYEKFYDAALISNSDKIIPPKNQINFWQGNAPYKILESGHFPFYNFKSWNEIAQAAE